MIRAELLAPAGNFEKLRAVLHFGADAAYLAGKRYGLRAFADNFDMPALRAAIAYAHARRPKFTSPSMFLPATPISRSWTTICPPCVKRARTP